ncbi:hypothetical protein AVEN_157596-1 [Araneus ventricosus]|uniref:Uncharacterized protein n=1 Tax=Araneus ventricosus TaxID=182803 RepID=A0A4Y2KDZ3_ARAVE|nr:hypothetical protein AVEN_157596-1 [Araneus ventricosus]
MPRAPRVAGYAASASLFDYMFSLATPPLMPTLPPRLCFLICDEIYICCRCRSRCAHCLMRAADVLFFVDLLSPDIAITREHDIMLFTVSAYAATLCRLREGATSERHARWYFQPLTPRCVAPVPMRTERCFVDLLSQRFCQRRSRVTPLDVAATRPARCVGSFFFDWL